MPRYEFQVRISADQLLRVYRGTAHHLVVRSTTGQRVQLPAALFRPYVTHDGVAGHFVLTCDDNNKCLDLQRLG